jgi:hypothetical protein
MGDIIPPDSRFVFIFIRDEEVAIELATRHVPTKCVERDQEEGESWNEIAIGITEKVR